MAQSRKRGLNSENIRIVVGFEFVLLLIFGPIEPFGLIVRTTYLIILPIVTYFLLKRIGRKWDAGVIENDRLERGLVGVMAGMLLLLGINELGSSGASNSGVGAYFAFAFACITFWYSVFRKSEPEQKTHDESSKKKIDFLYNSVLKLTEQHDEVSPALLQRLLKIDYTTARGLIDKLFEDGLIEEPDGARPRKVIQN